MTTPVRALSINPTQVATAVSRRGVSTALIATAVLAGGSSRAHSNFFGCLVEGLPLLGLGWAIYVNVGGAWYKQGRNELEELAKREARELALKWANPKTTQFGRAAERAAIQLARNAPRMLVRRGAVLMAGGLGVGVLGGAILLSCLWP